jgi:hypothetical protein
MSWLNLRRERSLSILRAIGAARRMRHEFEIRLLPRSPAATRRAVAFYVADPLSSIHEFPLG